MYNSEGFLKALDQKIKNHPFPECPYCGGKEFQTIPEGAMIPCYDPMVIVPASVIVCNNCGHMEFFSLRILGLLEPETEGQEEEQKEQEK